MCTKLLLPSLSYFGFRRMAGFFVFLYVLGVPLSFYAILHANRTSLFDAAVARDVVRDQEKRLQSHGKSYEMNRRESTVRKESGAEDMNSSAFRIQRAVRKWLVRQRFMRAIAVMKTQRTFGALFLAYAPRYYWW